MKTGKKEIILLVIIGCALAGFCVTFYLTRQTGKEVLITVDGKEYGRYSLSGDDQIPVVRDGKVTNTVTIEGGTVFMSEASCPNHLCILQGKKRDEGSSIVCLPNRVVVRITGKGLNGDGGYDAVAR